MADFAPPPGPPPPRVPEGWKAIWNAQYSEWFFVNIYTKQSQWDKPEQAVYPPGEAPHGAPPSYAPGSHSTSATDKASYGSNNPYGNVSEDEKLARRLQEEEQSRAGGHAGASNDFYNQAGAPASAHAAQQSYPQQNAYAQPQTTHQASSSTDKAKGLIGKLLGGKHSSGAPMQQHGYGAQPVYGAPAGYYGGHQVPYGRPARKPGMGAGGLAMGMGGGLLGGALLGSALGDAGDGGGFGDGGDGGGFGGDGGDYGGDGGGFGGDGGGDFGGGDFGGGD